jgi:hypothetical protein
MGLKKKGKYNNTKLPGNRCSTVFGLIFPTILLHHCPVVTVTMVEATSWYGSQWSPPTTQIFSTLEVSQRPHISF